MINAFFFLVYNFLMHINSKPSLSIDICRTQIQPNSSKSYSLSNRFVIKIKFKHVESYLTYYRRNEPKIASPVYKLSGLTFDLTKFKWFTNVETQMNNACLTRIFQALINTTWLIMIFLSHAVNLFCHFISWRWGEKEKFFLITFLCS